MALKEFLDIDGLNYYQDIKVQPALDKLSNIGHVHNGLPLPIEKRNVAALKDIFIRDVLVAGETELTITSPYFKKDGLVSVYISDITHPPVSVNVNDGEVTLTFEKRDENLDIAVVTRSSEYQLGSALFDTSDATATSDDIVKDKTAVVNNETVVGALECYEETTYIPSTTEQVIKAGKVAKSGLVLKGDNNLISDNILKGISIFGVTGTYGTYTVNINGKPLASPVTNETFNLSTDSVGGIIINE